MKSEHTACFHVIQAAIKNIVIFKTFPFTSSVRRLKFLANNIDLTSRSVTMTHVTLELSMARGFKFYKVEQKS